MTRPPPSDAPPRLMLDFSQPMRPKARARVKIIPGGETPPSAGTLAFSDRSELYQVLAERDRPSDA